MALQTITYSVGDYAYQSWSNAYVLELILTEDSINESENTSIISYELNIKSGVSNQYISNTPYGIELNGIEIASGIEGVNLPYNSSITLASGSTAIEHNADGTLDMSVYAWIDESEDNDGSSNRWAPPSMSIDETITLTPISRAFTLTLESGEGVESFTVLAS
jgi:hypothetical protein